MQSCRLLLSGVILVYVVSPPLAAQSDVLRYKSPSEKIYYRVTITVESPSSIDTYQGQISYERSANSAPSDNISVTFRGGLKKTTQTKRQGGSRFGPRGPGFRGGPPQRGGFPFGRGTATTALQQTTSKIVLAPEGDILSLTGSSQIPIPLGHLSILVFDALPGDAKDVWSVTDGVTLGKKKNNRSIRRGPFADQNDEERAAGSETATYTVTSRRKRQVDITKVYKLDSPNSDPPFTFGGEGQLVFDTKVGAFVSADLKYELVASPENVQVKFPVTVKYESLSSAEVAEQDRKKQEAADAALEKGMVTARGRFKGFSEEKIAAIYAKGGQVPPTGRIITPEMEIPVGLIAQNKWPNEYRWSATRIAQILPNNLIKIQSVESKRYYTRNRNTLSLAPDFVAQPHLSPEELAAFRAKVGPTPAK